MKILIVDDEKAARDRLNRMIKALGNSALDVSACEDKQTQTLGPSIESNSRLIDIPIPGMDAVQAARHLSKITQSSVVVITAAYADHALGSVKIDAIGYPLKLAQKEKRQNAINIATKPNKVAVLQKHAPQVEPALREHICARVRGSLVLVPIDEIYYFNADQKYIMVRYSGGEILIEAALKALELEFGDRFYRIHRNALISLPRVNGLQAKNGGHHVSFHGIENTLEVSRRNLSRVRKIIKRL